MKLNDSMDEDLINDILDRGITEIKSSTTSFNRGVGSLINQLSYNDSRDSSAENTRQPKSSALKALLEDLKNEYKSKPLLNSPLQGEETNRTKLSNFDDMKVEIQDLQDKLNGLEGKMNTTGSREQSITKYKTKDTIYQSDDEASLGRTNRFKGKTVTTVKTNKSVKSVNSSQSPNISLNKSLTKSIKSFDSNISTSKINWKEKYYKMKTLYEDKKSELAKERLLLKEFQKKNKQMVKKDTTYDSLLKLYKDLQIKLDKTVKKFEDSEFIRKEQSRLIKAMHGELELLRCVGKEENATPKKKKSTSKPKIKKKK
jgi:hypothetical protein